MIGSWMLHAVLVTLLLGLAARAAEGALRAYRLPVRWAWLGAAAGALALPAAAATDLGRRVGDLLASSAGGGTVGLTPGGAAGAAPPPTGVEGIALPALPAALEPAAAAVWLGGSLLMGALAVRSWRELRLRLRGWERTSVDGVAVLVSDTFGPAAVGVFDPVPVLPAWVLELPDDERRLVLRHELEHRNAGDPALLGFAVAALVAAPWNPVLWWIVRRLRLAVELDCDRRVLSTGASPADYGALLVEITRGRRSGALPVAALGEGSSRLERRIRAMTDPIPTFRTARTALLTLAAAGLLLAACDAPTPSEEPPTADGAASSGDAGADVAADGAGDLPRFVPRDADPRATNNDEIRRLLKRYYPPMLRDAGIGGTVTLWLFVNDRGQVEEIQLQKSSGYDAFDQAAVKVAKNMNFEPATRDGDPIGVWVSRSITFAASGGDDGTSAGDGDATASGDGGGPLRALTVRRGATLQLDGENAPAIFVDGERLVEGNGALEELRPDEIESIEVIKGPAAEELYGEEGRDGVIRITTRAAASSG